MTKEEAQELAHLLVGSRPSLNDERDGAEIAQNGVVLPEGVPPGVRDGWDAQISDMLSP